jgi:DNA-directed RNA polymerase specialized sigma24 family protein
MSSQSRLDAYGIDNDLSALLGAERKAFVAIEYNDVGVREFARHTERSPGTISNLLDRARRRLGEK